MNALRATILLFLLTAFTTGEAAGLEVGYVGAFRDGLLAPTSVVVGSDQVAVLEPYSRRLTLLTADGRFTCRVDLAGDAIGLARYSGSLYLFCDRTQQSVIAVDLDHGRQFEFFRDVKGNSDPVDIIVSGRLVYVLDASRAEIVVLTENGHLVERIAIPSASTEKAAFLSSFTYDPIRNRFYVVDQVSSRVHAVDRQGKLQASFGSFGGADGNITRAGEIACDATGRVYVVDRYQGRVVVFSAEGEFLMNVEPDALGAPRLSVPVGIAIDESGLLYVASAERQSIEIYHIAGGSDSQRTILAAPVYPVSNDTVDASGLKLIANAKAPAEAVATTSIDFQLFEEDGVDTPMVEALDVPASSVLQGDSLTVILTAEWQPAAALADGATFGWRVRTRAAGQLGEWSLTQRFVTRAGLMEYRLVQNYPNPFNPSTNVSFTLPVSTGATFAIYNLLGQDVWSQSWEQLPAGQHVITWNGLDQNGNQAASGVYFYRLTAGTFSRTKKMVLLR